LLFNANDQFYSYIKARTNYIRRDDDDNDVNFVLDHHAELDAYSVSSLKQQFMGKHVPPLRHIIMIPSQSVCSYPFMLRA
jgi:hypothetical protein